MYHELIERRRDQRAAELFHEHEQQIFVRTDRMFAVLMVLQWLAGIGAAVWISPRTWIGASSQVHLHVWAAIGLGGLLTFFPVLLALALPGRVLTRHVVAAGQVLTSALLIHLTGGRIETHFHVFGSLAFIAFYRDWRVMITATLIVTADHFLRGVLWPQSVYGILAAEPFRWLEHAGWVLFGDTFLILSIVQSRNEMRAIAERQANLEAVNEGVELQVRERTVALSQSEAALRAALETAQESERLKTDFLASMSHEIRTPLNGVLGMTGLILDTELTGEQREFAEMIRGSGDSLLTIINDILDFSKIEAGKLGIEPIAFDLEAAVEDVVDLLAAKASEKNVNFALRCAAGLPKRVVGDPGRVRQVLTNLVGNAIKFTEAGDVTVEVDCERQDAAGAWCRFSVHDTGIGIPADKRQHIFERFTQADTSTTRKYGGTGLGLAISKQLVELMDGAIGVDSEPGHGSTFWFTMPLPLAPDRGGAEADEMSTLRDVRVLIVDDNAVNRRILHELVTRWGMRNGGFASGEAALSALHAARAAGDPFRIALVDMQMPGMDGEMLARAIKADENLKETVLILLSSGARAEAWRIDAAGFAAYLSKPVRAGVLLEAVSKAWLGRESSTGTARHIARPSLSEPQEEGRLTVQARVLLVEDNPMNQRLGRVLLERLGCRVDTAADGVEAVEMVQSIPYDIVFMDCQMPEMDGYEATRHIRRLETARRHVPIVAMTANAMAGDRQKCLAAGMNDYLGKPIRRAELAAAVHRWAAGGGQCGDSTPLEDLA